MKIALIASHAWPIPNAARTGDIYVLDLAKGLEALGHDVTMFSPAGTDFHRLRPTACAYGKVSPQSHERATVLSHIAELRTFDIVHDHSTSKIASLGLNEDGRPVCTTLTGGPWRDAMSPVNLCVFSRAQRERVLRGATDYDGSPTPDAGGHAGYRVGDAHVVYAGVDTDFYCPGDGTKGDYALWLNRWHPVKGYELAIRIAKETGISLVMAGIHPDDATNEHERGCAMQARELARGVHNIDFRWLPGDANHDVAKRDLYRQAKALLYPVQFQEPFGLSMVEALACGTPVVGSRMGSVPEVIGHALTGYLCNIDADVVNNFAVGCDAARAMNPEACRHEAVTRFSREAMARAYLAEYERIIAGERW